MSQRITLAQHRKYLVIQIYGPIQELHRWLKLHTTPVNNL